MDPYDFAEAINVVGQIPQSFYTQIESKKWSERKEALEIIEKVTATPKIQNSDFSELVRVLKKVIGKDANIVVATLAAKCLCQLAQGLRANFGPHASYCMPVLFEKFKEKKPNVVSVLRDTTDAVFIGTNIESILEDVVAFLDNKNPQIKAETSLFLARVFARHPQQVMNKKTLRPLITALIKSLSDTDPTVRDNASMAIGTAMKVTGEKLMLTFIADVEPIKMARIKENFEKAQVKKLPKAVVNNDPVPPPASQPRKSTATMVRSTSNRRLTVGGAKPVSSKPPPTMNSSSSATVKRNATIIKRSTVPKRPLQQQQQPPPQLPPAPPAPSQPPTQMQPPQQVLQQPQYMQPNNFSTPAKPVFASTQAAIKDVSLDAIILKIIFDNTNEVMDALIHLDDSLSDDTEMDYEARINQIVDLCSIQLVKSFGSLKQNDPGATQRIRAIYDLLSKLFIRQRITTAASPQSIRFLLIQLFTLLQICDDGNVRKTLNSLAVAVVDSFEPAVMMCILTGLLNEPSPASIVEPIKDAIIRSMRSFK